MPDLSVPTTTPPRSGLAARARSLVGERGTPRRALASNGAWNVATMLAGAVAVFGLRPFVVASLGDALFGVWSIVAAMTSYMGSGVADLGVRPAIVHFVAKHDALGDADAVNRYVNTAFVVFAATGTAVLLLTGLAVPLLPRLFDIAPDAIGDARWALGLSGLDIALAMPLNAYSAVLVGKQRFVLLNQVNLLVLVGKSAAIVALLSAGHGIVALALVNLAGSVLEMGAKSFAAFRIEPRLRFAPGLARRDAAKELLKYGGLAVIVSLSLVLVWQTDAIVIGAMISVPAVTWFANGSCLPAKARDLTVAAGRVLEPAAGALDATGDVAAIRRMIGNGAKTLLLLAGPMLCYFVVVGDAFLARWFGESHRPVSGHVLAILALGAAGPIASYPFVSVMYGANRMKTLAILAIVEGTVNLGLSLVLARSHGVVGVALGTAIPAAVFHGLLIPHYVGRPYGIRLAPFLLVTWAKPLAASVATVFVLRALAPAGARFGWLELAGIAAAAAATFYATYALLARITSRGDAEVSA